MSVEFPMYVIQIMIWPPYGISQHCNVAIVVASHKQLHRRLLRSDTGRFRPRRHHQRKHPLIPISNVNQ